MMSNGREFPDTVTSSREYYEIRNEPINVVSGGFSTLDAARRHSVKGDVIYKVTETTARLAVEVRPED
jgi:hypothetical protein